MPVSNRLWNSKGLRTRLIMPTNRTRIAILLARPGTAGFAGACTTKTVQTAPNLAVPVTVAKAEPKDDADGADRNRLGRGLQPSRFKSQVNAALEQVHFTQGEFVKKGELLFTLDAPPVSSRTRPGAGNCSRTTRRRPNWTKSQAERYQKLFEAGVTPKEQFDQMKARRSRGKKPSVAGRRRGRRRPAKLQLEYCYMYSPIDGRTGALQVYPGNLVKQNDVPMLDRHQPDHAALHRLFDSRAVSRRREEITWPRADLQVEATPYGETKPEIGYLTFVDNSVDNTTGTIKLKATFAESRSPAVAGPVFDRLTAARGAGECHRRAVAGRSDRTVGRIRLRREGGHVRRAAAR